jgi:nitrate reductase gamma subunit
MSFKTLFRHTRRLWLVSYIFHVALVAVIVWFILFMLGLYVPRLVKICGYVMLVACVYLVLVRVLVPQMRALSTFVEYFNLALFILIAITGLSITGGGLGEQARAYFVGLISFSPISPPPNATFLLNLLLLEFFLVYFPFSKMFHVASKYFAYHKIRWMNPYEQPQRAH